MLETDLKPAAELESRLRFLPDSGQIWLDQQRMIMVHAEAMGELRRELVDTLGRERARGVLTRMGHASGIRDARFARRLFPTASDSEVFVVGPQLHNLEGIIDVRVIAATNIDLDGAVRAGTFRADLYYRLNPYPVRIPPLRERLADIPLLVQHFVQRYGVQHGKRIPGVTEAAMAGLTSYPWPGNIRELKNIVESGSRSRAFDEIIAPQ